MKNMKPSRAPSKLPYIVLPAGIFIAVALYLLLNLRPTAPGSRTIRPPTTDIPPAGQISVKGTITCLPNKNSGGPTTLECAIGLKDETGRYFALRDTDPNYGNLSATPSNTSVIVEGRFVPEPSGKYQDIGRIEVTRIAPDENGWKTYTDPGRGIIFRYPENLSTKYIDLVDWPPAITISAHPFTCTEAGSETDRAGETRRVVIGTRTYCVTKETEGAAGSIYTRYTYTASIDGKSVILTFSLRFVQCGNYPEPEITACEQERTSFDIDATVDRIMQTVVLQ